MMAVLLARLTYAFAEQIQDTFTLIIAISEA